MKDVIEYNEKPHDGEVPLDKLGRQVLKGDIICYPGRTRSSIWLEVAEVMESGVGPDGQPFAKLERITDRHKTTIRTFPRAVIIDFGE